jgi:serine/threonine-protein kinase
MGEAADPDETESLVGRTLGGKYLLTRRLGRGGFGEVYEATNTNTEGRVAIKTLHAHLVGNTGVRKRFLAEARAATKVQHDHVIKVFDLDVDPQLGVPYIVQEFLAGETLEARLAQSPDGRLAPEAALRVAAPVMSALVAAHAQGIVHRDLKPANIFLAQRRDGEEWPTVIDFGIAKFGAGPFGTSATKTGALLGSPAYMSPEQASGEVSLIDGQTDVWAMGVVLYEMLTGRHPYEADNYNRILGMIQFVEPVTLGARATELGVELPADLVAVIDHALARKRADRTPSMQVFLTELLATGAATGIAVTLPAGATTSTPPTRLTPPSAPPASAVKKVETLREGWSTASFSIPSSGDRLMWITFAAVATLAGIAGAVLLTSHKPAPAAVVQAAVRPTTTPVAPPETPVTPVPASPSTTPQPASPTKRGAVQTPVARPVSPPVVRPRIMVRPTTPPTPVTRPTVAPATRPGELQPDHGYPGS